MKLGLDIHKTIDANPKLFVKTALTVIDKGGEVHIITGISQTVEVLDELLSYNNGEKWWTHFYSVQDTLVDSDKNPTGVVIDQGNRRLTFSENDWDTVKAEYCKDTKIDLHVDDSDRYLRHFNTPWIKYTNDEINDKHILSIIESYGSPRNKGEKQ